MKRLLTFALAAIGVWVLTSFGGAMIDTVRAEFWTQSLMWSLVTMLVLAPLLIMLSSRAGPEPSPGDHTRESQPDAAPAFVSEDAEQQVGRLWPEDASKPENREVA